MNLFTLRQRLIDAVRARLQLITVANGYQTDIGRAVFVWRAMPLGEAETPFLNVKDVKRVSKQVLLGRQSAAHEHTLTMWVEVLARPVPGSVQADDMIRAYLGDIEKAVGLDRYWTEAATSTPLATDTRPAEDQMSVEQAGQIIGGTRYVFTIDYRTAAFDPFTQ